MNRIIKRQTREKQLVVDQLKKTPIIQAVCQKVGIGRGTYYRWLNDDPEFAGLAEEAIAEGNSLVNDMAESQLMAAVREQNLTAIMYWLKHHHPLYATKVEVTARLKRDEEQLTPEQEILVIKALKLASVIPNAATEITEEKQV